MRLLLCLLFVASCTLANKNDNRRNKLPFVADAVGNTLPPPSNVPATVGSPVTLLTPDRYEFYTFDESGELVKRLMTLEEIQAIVAAGEETDGLVTFANDNQPTAAFNVNPPPYTKVHSVVANVQNVLKAQMEAHKNRPPMQLPTLDTPDVSNSWSLILPSIFGNTGVDIIPDKSSGAVTTPDTETLEEEIDDDENSLSKEGDREVVGSSTVNEDEKVLVTESNHQIAAEVSTEKSTTTTFTSTTTPKLTTAKIVKVTTKKPASLTTKRSPPISSTTRRTTSIIQTKTTNKPANINNITTSKPLMTTTTTTTVAPKTETTTTKYVLSVSTNNDNNNNNIEILPNSNTIASTEKNHIEFEKISTFIPVSTVTYVNEHSTQKPIDSTKATSFFASTTKRSVTNKITSPTTQATTRDRTVTTNKPFSTSTTKRSDKNKITYPTTQATTPDRTVTTNKPFSSTLAFSTIIQRNEEKLNLTTITTQSVSPSTTITSTELSTFNKINLPTNMVSNPNFNDTSNTEKYDEPLPLFDVAQSISQIASDLGGNYQPLPTTSNLLDTTHFSLLDLESKENIDIDIPSSTAKETDVNIQEDITQNNDNFVKISTIDPHHKNDFTEPEEKVIVNSTIDLSIKPENEKTSVIIDTVQKVDLTSAATTSEITTIDPVLFESVEDLMSQVVNEPPSIMDSESKNEHALAITTTQKTTTMIESLKDEKEKNNIYEANIITSAEKLIELTSERVTKINKTNLEFEKQKNDETEIHPVADTDPETNSNSLLINKKIIPVKDQTFVQIAGSTNVTMDNKNESIINNKNDLNQIVSQSKIEVTEKIDTTKEYEQKATTVSDLGLKDNPGIESTTAFPDQNVPVATTIQANKHSQFNKVNSKITGNTTTKKEKLPELLPKVDDFKKKIQKVNIVEEELISQRNNTWKLLPTLSPPKANEIPKENVKSDNYNSDNYNKDIVLEFSNENQGLEVTTKFLEEDVARFSELSNELAFRYWNVIIDDIDKRRSFVFSPYSTFSLLAMIFMGAKGATSGEMNEILKLDDMVTFNPHFTLKNISDSIETSAQSGVAVSAFIRELYSDRNKGKILTFYKERAQQFYNGHVEEVNFKLISDIIRRRTNLLVKRYTWGKIPEFMKTNNIVMQPPLAAFTTNIFQTDCSGTSVDGRDGEMYFVVSPNVRQRRLVPVPAVVYKKGFLAGYDPVLDVTVAALGNTNTVISTLFLMPGQQGNIVHADDLEKLEQRLLEALPTTPTWNRILRTLLPRVGLELQIPRFSHKSTFNTSLTLKKMGLKDLFDGEHADLGGVNGPSKDLYLSDMVQLNTFVTCGEGVIGEQHHIEEYPEILGAAQRRRARWLNDWDEPRDYQRAFHDPHDISDAMHLPLHLRPRQARLPARSTQPARLKFDRPFLYFVRHNPTGMILYFGRYNPRLLP